MLNTKRLALRRFTDADLDDFALLHGNPQTMRDYPNVLSRAESAEKLARYLKAEHDDGFSRLRVSDHSGNFLGYTGLLRQTEIPEVGDSFEMGWRFLPTAWGQGYATEAAQAVIEDAFANRGLELIYAYTAPDNLASQAVMGRLGLVRREELDFRIRSGPDKDWHGMVWEARKHVWR